jgi:hypothetical protein
MATNNMNLVSLPVGGKNFKIKISEIGSPQRLWERGYSCLLPYLLIESEILRFLSL